MAKLTKGELRAQIKTLNAEIRANARDVREFDKAAQKAEKARARVAVRVENLEAKLASL